MTDSLWNETDERTAMMSEPVQEWRYAVKGATR